MSNHRRYNKHHLARTPVALEHAKARDITSWKRWDDVPHKRYDFVITDDNWICLVTWLFDDGSFSLCGKYIVSNFALAKKKTYRLFEFNHKRIRFNNRVKILVNTALLLGNWEKAYEIAYGKKATSLFQILKELDKGGEDFLMDTVAEQLKECGVTDDFVIETLKQMSQGFKINADGEKVEDKNVRDTTRVGILFAFARMLGIESMAPQITYNDNRKAELDFGQVLKQLKE